MSKNIKYLIIVITVFFIITLISASVYIYRDNFKPNQTAANSNVAQQQWRTFQDTDLGYAITYPSDWGAGDVTISRDVVPFDYLQPPLYSRGFATAEGADAMARDNSVYVYVGTLIDPNMSLVDIMRQDTEVVKIYDNSNKGYSESQIVNPQKIQVSGFDAITYDVDRSNYDHLTVIELIAKKESTLYIVKALAANEEIFASTEQTMRDVVASFKLLP